eukprot:TRINITY_DN2993_c0_g1_i2.p1 TRINITY_DN2993_c0_g1~~TRINITY_DN2993_c0_g1_i2.p1  ORF type:complete len:297 (+),score=91.07 TRINITY_DN2993_c0_g1_i2:589-1479(+)
MELDLQALLSETIQVQGEKQLSGALGQSVSFGRIPKEDLYKENFAAGTEMLQGYQQRLKCIHEGNLNLKGLSVKCDELMKLVILHSFRAQYEWKLLSEHVPTIPLLITGMNALRGKLVEISKKTEKLERILTEELEEYKTNEIELTRRRLSMQLEQHRINANKQVDELQHQMESDRQTEKEEKKKQIVLQMKRLEEQEIREQKEREWKLHQDIGRQLYQYQVYGIIGTGVGENQTVHLSPRRTKLEEIQVPQAKDELELFLEDLESEKLKKHNNQGMQQNTLIEFDYIDDEDPFSR